MREKRMPILISIPHGGTKIPKEAEHLFRLDLQEVLRDGDTWVREIFDFREAVEVLIDTPIPRVIIDLNRQSEDLPPKNFDGVVKTKSLFYNQVWEDPNGLPKTIQEELIEKYYRPYYRKVSEALQIPSLKLAIDCHSMLPKDPFDEAAPKRPLFCISNRGGRQGQQETEPVSAPQEILQSLQHLLEKEFGKGSVLLNSPFKGGQITRYFSKESAVPWLQLEVNRSLYLPEEEIIPETPTGLHLERVTELNQKILKAIRALEL